VKGKGINMKEKALQFMFLLFVLLMLAAGSVKAQVVNGGFEESGPLSPSENSIFLKSLKANNWKFEEPLVYPAGWQVNTNTKDGEYRLVKDSAQSHSGNNCVFIKGHLMIRKVIAVTPGDEIDLSFYVKDPEKKEAIIYYYSYGKTDEGKRMNTGGFSFKTETEAEWSKKEWKFTVPENSGGRKLYELLLAITSKTGVYYDDIEMTHKKSQ